MAVLNLNTEQYKSYINGEKPVLVEFWAPWCVYCRRLAPALDMLEQQRGEELIIAKVNIDDYPALAEEEKIELVPTLLLYQGGRLLGSTVAPESRAQLEEFLGECLESSRKDEQKDSRVYDMLIIGGGPGGYTAALYAARAGLDAIVLEKLSAGGQMALTEQIDNYPGFEAGIDGMSLGERMQKGAERFGVETKITDVASLKLDGEIKSAETGDGVFYGRTVVMATGASPRELGLENEHELIGKGVNYCAACDGMFYKGKTVAVIGGGNSAVADALRLSRICEKVFLIHRRDTLRATKVYYDQLIKAGNIEFIWDSVVEQLLHDQKLTGLRLKNVRTGEQSELQCDGIFVSVGRKPATAMVKEQLELDSAGYIVADETTKASLPGVFAVGDVRTKAVRQVVTAVGDGAAAVHFAEQYLAGEQWDR